MKHNVINIERLLSDFILKKLVGKLLIPQKNFVGLTKESEIVDVALISIDRSNGSNLSLDILTEYGEKFIVPIDAKIKYK